MENATRASGIVVSTQVAGGGWERRAGVGDVISRGQQTTQRELVATMSSPGWQTKQRERAADDGARQKQERAVDNDDRR